MDKPWRIDSATLSSVNGGLSVTGWNGFTESAFSWHIGHYGILWTIRKRYDTSETVWGPGARKRLADLLRLARRGRRGAE